MRKTLIILVGAGVYIGELILVIILLAAISSFFPENVNTFIPQSSNYVLIVLINIIRLIAVAVALFMLRREIIQAKKDWAAPKGFWFLSE